MDFDEIRLFAFAYCIKLSFIGVLPAPFYLLVLVDLNMILLVCIFVYVYHVFWVHWIVMVHTVIEQKQ